MTEMATEAGAVIGPVPLEIELFDPEVTQHVFPRPFGLSGEGSSLCADQNASAATNDSRVRRSSIAVVCKGLIDVKDSQLTEPGYSPALSLPLPDHEEWDVQWCVPGPLHGPFSFSEDLDESAEIPPNRIPVRMILRPQFPGTAGEATREGLPGDRGESEIADRVVGWIKKRDCVWPPVPVPPFPYLDVDSIPRNAQSRIEGSSASAHEDQKLPLILKSTHSTVSINADALGTILLTLTEPDFQELEGIVRSGDQITGHCSVFVVSQVAAPSSPVLVASSARSVLRSTRVTITSARSVSQRAKRLRFEWELAETFRQARYTFQAFVPPCDAWEESELHCALRESLPSLAREGSERAWNPDERKKMICKLLRLVLDCRLSSVPDSLKPRSGEWFDWAAAPGSDEYGRIRSNYALGVGRIDPWTYSLCDGPDTDHFATLARHYEQIPGLWSPTVCRAILHGLLLSETSAFLVASHQHQLGDSLFGRSRGKHLEPDLTHVALYNEWSRYSKTQAERRDQLSKEKWRQERRAARVKLRMLLTAWLLPAAVAGALGFWVAGLKGAVVGFLGGGWLIGWRVGEQLRHRFGMPGLESEKCTPEDQLKIAMQKAVEEASGPLVCWEQLRRRMQEADDLGAAWRPEAWRLVDDACRHEAASHIGGY